MTQFLSPKDLDEIKIGKDLLTADGDLITRQAGNVIALPAGNQGQVLTVGLSLLPEWADPQSGGSSVSDLNLYNEMGGIL